MDANPSPAGYSAENTQGESRMGTTTMRSGGIYPLLEKQGPIAPKAKSAAAVASH